MDFKRIRHFVTVAESRSLTAASERLHIVQPAISQSIKKLEEEMGVSLFIRSRRGMALTEAGTMFLKYAYGILNQFNRAKENISTIGQKPRGEVSVAMTASALNVLSVPVYTILKDTYPDIQINLEEGLTDNLQHGFEAGWYDLVITFNPAPNESVHLEDLILEDLFLVTPYNAKSPKEISFSKMGNFPMIIPKDQGAIGQTIAERAKQENIELQAVNITAAMHPALTLIEAGNGNTILPWSGIYDRVAQKRLSARKITSPRLTRRVCMEYPTQRPLTPASIAVMSVIRQATLQSHTDDNWRGELLVSSN